MRSGALVVASIAALACPGAALAQPQPIVVGQPVAGPANDQHSTATAMAGDGRFAVAYEEQPNPGNSDVIVRRFHADLTPAGPPAAVNDTAERRWAPAIGMAPDGRYVVAYVHTGAGSNDDIRAQRFAANGTPVGAELEVNPPGEAGQQYQPSVAVAPDGRFLVAWATTLARVAARAYGADGTPAAAAATIDAAGNASEPAVAVDPAGKYIVAWDRQTVFGDPGRVMARRFLADGTPDGADFAAHTGATNANFGPPSIGLAADGTFVLLFTRFGGALNEVVLQRQGGTAFKANDTFADTYLPVVTVDADGHYALVWEDRSGGVFGLRLRRFAPGDAAEGPSQDAGGGGTVVNPAPSIAGDGAGRILIGWTGADTGSGSTGAYITRFDAEGVVSPPPPPPQTTPPATTQPPPPPPPAPPFAAPVRSAPPAAAPLPAFATVVTLPSARRCVSRRSFRIRIARRRGLTIARAEVAVNGRRVKVVRGARLTAPVNLTSLPKGRFTVAITVVTADGRTLKGTRKYRTCTPKRRGGRRPRL